jgi:hypothetical protein
MAGDWIKIRYELVDDPAVIGMSEALDMGTETIVGHLVHFWIWVDKQCADSNAPSVTKRWLDRYVNVPGFTDALLAAGWLERNSVGFTIPNFERHFGKCSKRRGLAALRQQRSRKSNAASATKSASRASRNARSEQEQEQEQEQTAAAAAASPVSERLVKFGFSEPDTDLILNLPNFTEKRLDVAMQNAAVKRRSGKLRSPLGYVRTAIEKGYSLLREAEKTETPWWEDAE